MKSHNFKELAEKYGTPFYLFDFEILKNRIELLNNKLPKNAELCYAIKANAFLLQALKDLKILFEVCSTGELSICHKYNVNPNHIVFSGVVKTKEDIKNAWKMHVNTITLESLEHCRFLKEVANEENGDYIQNVLIRLSSGNQFGMSENDVLDALKILKQLKNVNFRGVHYFSGTQKKLKKIETEIQYIQDYCDNLQKMSGIKFNEIEYGPGFSFDYFAQPDFSENYNDFDAVAGLLEKSRYKFTIEAGRFIASSCGFYVSRIMDLKSTNDVNYCLIDGGINHLNYYGQIMGMKIPPVSLVKNNADAKSENSSNFEICGSLCTTADVITKSLPLASPAIADFLVFKNIGAYSVTEGIYLFLSHALPCVVSYDKMEYKVLRQSFETYKINS